jgi:hypothetical protein
MPFSSPYIGSTPYEDDTSVTILMLNERPDVYTDLVTPLKTGQIVGYYNSVVDAVEMYTIDETGYRYIRIV